MQATDVQMIADRWMLESRRLINWGSYEGYHEFRPSTDHKLPVTLLAGASESGKSTLVDAQISLLYPTGTPFNKASNSGRSERSDYTYLRGMVGVGSTKPATSRSTCAAATRTAHRNPCGAPSWTPIATRPPARCSPAPNSST